jgi:signal transduction histidine kinase
MSDPAAPPRGRLARKYALLFIALVGAALVVNSAFDFWLSYQENKASLVLIQREKADAAAQRIEEFIGEIERQIGWTTHAQWAAAPLDQRRFDYVRLLRQVPAITELSELDKDGREQLKVSRLSMDVVGSEADLSQSPAFLGAKAHGTWFSPVYFRKQSEPYLTLAVARAGRNAGVTVAEINLKLISDVITGLRIGKGGYAYLVDGAGKLIAHPDISLVLRDTDLSSLPQVAAALSATPQASPIADNIAGKPVLTAHAAVAPVGWWVFVEVPLSEAFAPLYGAALRSLGLLAAGLVIAALAAFFLARRMTGPIRTLREGAARIGAGELGRRIEIRTGDELEDLAGEFNRMAADLQKSYAELERRVEERTAELAEALEQQTATAEVLQVINSSPGNLVPVFDAMLEKAMRLCEASFGQLAVYEDGRFRTVASQGMPTAWAEYRRSNPPDYGPGTQPARLLAGERLIHIVDLKADPVYQQGEPNRRALVDLGGVRASLMLPLRREGVFLGFINLYRQEPRAFTEKQIALLQNFAAQAVIAIENARLITETREALEQQTATAEVLGVINSSPGDLVPVFDAILEKAHSLCGADFGGLLTYDGESFRAAALRGVPAAFAAVARQPFRLGPRNHLNRLIRGEALIHIADLAETAALAPDDQMIRAAVERGGIRTLLAVPLRKDDRLLGIITAYRQEVRPFSDKQIALLQNFAAQAVIAMENARLLGELRESTAELARSVEELQALAEVGRAVSSTLDLQQVLGTILARSVDLSGADAGAIFRYSPAGLAYHLVEARGWDARLVRAVRELHIDGAATGMGEAAARREPLQFADLAERPSYPLRDLTLAAGFRSVLIVPLIGAERVFGAIVLERRITGEFPAATVRLMQTIASQSALAIQNAGLFREIADKSEALALASQHKSQFLANMSHELRTPLNAILGYAELMADGLYGELPERAAEVLERVQNNGRHLLALINDVLDLSKIEAGQLTLSLEDYALGEIVQSVVAAAEPLATTKGLKFTAETAPGLPRGHGDPRRIAQVLLNLAGNAIKFTDAGEVAIRAEAENGRFIVTVRDTGPGIAPEDHAKIFDEFQQVDNSSTRKKGGTGLGLAISKRMVEMQGGTLTVDSELGAGATFRVTLPIRVAAAEELLLEASQ